MEFQEKAYEALVSAVFQRFPSVQKAGFDGASYKPGLSHMEAFDAALGYPSRAFRSVHVAGTNGKGSVCHMLAGIFAAAGLRTGLYTSPHISDFRERIRVFGAARAASGFQEGVVVSGGLRSQSSLRPLPQSTSSSLCDNSYLAGPSRRVEITGPPEISDLWGVFTGVDTPPETTAPSFPASGLLPTSDALVPREYAFEFLSRWQAYFEEHDLSFFEITTGMAFRYFADCGVDVAVIETGLGGLLDSTNIITPVLSIVTNIGLDHMAYLGDTLPEIAAQKAGIFKPGVPALVGESNPGTDPVFAEAAWMRCPLTFADQVKPSLWHRSRQLLAEMDLQASVQQKNLRTVLAALDILRDCAAFRPDEETVADAIIHTARRTGFHGRWEKLSDVPYILCDIGHNAHALTNNFAQLRRELSSGRFQGLIIVYGIMADKDFDAILPLMPPDATYFFAAPDTPRALPAADILRRYKAWCEAEGRSSVRAYEAPSVREAVRMATTMAQTLAPARPLIYIGGSTFVVSEAVKLFR